jgi:long-subunit fatty acid transport protein
MNGQQTATQEQENISGTPIGAPTQVRDGRGRTYVPALAQVGISFDNDKNWSLNLDASQQQWSKFTSFGDRGIALKNTGAPRLGERIHSRPGFRGALLPARNLRAGVNIAAAAVSTQWQNLVRPLR